MFADPKTRRLQEEAVARVMFNATPGEVKQAEVLPAQNHIMGVIGFALFIILILAVKGRYNHNPVAFSATAITIAGVTTLVTIATLYRLQSKQCPHARSKFYQALTVFNTLLSVAIIAGGILALTRTLSPQSAAWVMLGPQIGAFPLILLSGTIALCVIKYRMSRDASQDPDAVGAAGGAGGAGGNVFVVNDDENDGDVRASTHTPTGTAPPQNGDTTGAPPADDEA